MCIIIHLSSPGHDLYFLFRNLCEWKRRNSNISPMVSDYHSQILIPLYRLTAKSEGRGGQSHAFLWHCSLSMLLLRSLLFVCLCCIAELQNFREPEVHAVALEKHSRACMHWGIAWQGQCCASTSIIMSCAILTSWHNFIWCSLIQQGFAG